MADKEWTPEEEQILKEVAERKGWSWAEEHAELILTQARLVGELKDEDRS